MSAVAHMFDFEIGSNSYRQHYSAGAGGKTTLFPEVIDTLTRLQAQGYKLAIATGKSRKGLDNSLCDTGIGNFFHMTRCADEAFSKPHPQMLFDIMDGLSTRPEHTLMIGDSEYDLLMARNASVAPLAVSYGTQSREQLLRFGPLACLEPISSFRAAATAAFAGQGQKRGVKFGYSK